MRVGEEAAMAKGTVAVKTLQEKDRGKMREPEAGRPIMPALYGMGKAKNGTMKWANVCRQLEASRNYWICTTRADGRPHAMPVWGFWFARCGCVRHRARDDEGPKYCAKSACGCAS